MTEPVRCVDCKHCRIIMGYGCDVQTQDDRFRTVVSDPTIRYKCEGFEAIDPESTLDNGGSK